MGCQLKNAPEGNFLFYALLAQPVHLARFWILAQALQNERECGII